MVKMFGEHDTSCVGIVRIYKIGAKCVLIYFVKIVLQCTDCK